MADAAHEAADAQIAAFKQEVAETYLEAQFEAQQAFQGFLARFEKQDGEMSAAVARGEVARADWIAWRKGKMATGKRLSAVLDQMARAYSDANEHAMAMLAGRLPEVYAENFNYGTYQCETGAGVSTAFTLMDADTASRLFTAPGSYLPRPSVDRRKDVAWNRRLVKSQLTQGVLLGESIPKMAARVQRVTGSNMATATRTARTATTAAENAGRTDGYRRAQAMGIELEQEWLATLDGRTRHSHRQMDGERVGIGERFSNGCMYPGDPTAAYAETMNCRCTLVAAVKGIDQSDAARWSRLPQGMTYGQWKTQRQAAQITGVRQRARFAERVQRTVKAISEANRVLRFSAFSYEKPKREGIRLGKKEYARVMAAINDNFHHRFDSKKNAAITVGKHIYRFEVSEFGEYRFLSKTRLR